MQRSYRIGESVFGIRSTSQSFADWLDYALGRYQDDGEVRASYSIVVGSADDRRRSKRFHILYRGAGAVERTLDAGSLARVLFAELGGSLLGAREDAIYLRHGLVGWNGSAVLAPASLLGSFGGIGRHVDRAGVWLSSSDHVAVDQRLGTIVELPRMLDIPDDAVARLERLIPSGGRGHRVDAPTSRAVDGILQIVNQNDDRAPSRALVVQELAASCINLEVMGGRALEGLAALAMATPCYSMEWTRPTEVLGQVIAALGGDSNRGDGVA